jgi:hypothetical protein
MGSDEETGCYFRRQPRSPEELEQAIEAVRVSCAEALLYAVNDSEIVERLGALGSGVAKGVEV